MNSPCANHMDVVLEFFEICFHSILFLRKVYPSSIFTLKKKYNVPVHVCIYPDLNKYISDVLKSINKFLLSNKLKEISLWILDASLHPVEKFVFNNINIEREHSLLSTEFEGTNKKQIEDAFRTFCLKLSTNSSVLKTASDNSSFRIFIRTDQSGYSSLCEDLAFEGFPWIAEDSVPQNELKEIIPIQSLNNPVIQFEFYAEI